MSAYLHAFYLLRERPGNRLIEYDRGVGEGRHCMPNRAIREC